VRSNGKQGDGISARSSAPAVNSNGLVVAFDSAATNLVGGDSNGAVDVFVRDRASGRTQRVSVTSKGKEANGSSSGPDLSGDGRLVSFSSSATNLVPGDTNGRTDIFVHDRVTGQTTRVSVAADGTQGDNTSLGTAAISSDGGLVAFASDASNLVPQPASGRHIYVKDLATGAIQRVSVDSAGNPAQGFVAASPSLSGDGAWSPSPRARATSCPATPTRRSTCSSTTASPQRRCAPVWTAPAARPTGPACART
jgi:Tol biopolymer transport system component